MGVGGLIGIGFGSARSRVPRYVDLPGTVFSLDLTLPGAVSVDGSNNVTLLTDALGNTATPTGSARPLYVASGSDSRPLIRGNGTTVGVKFPTPQLPGATAGNYLLWYGVVKVNSLVQFSQLCGDGSSGAILAAIVNTDGIANKFVVANGSAGPASTGWGSYVRFWGLFSASSGDTLKVGSNAPVVGPSAGASAPAQGVSLFARGGGAAGTFVNADIYTISAYRLASASYASGYVAYADAITSRADHFPTAAV